MSAGCGASSGAICASTVAWERPDQFRNVIRLIGSFTNIRGGHVYPELVKKAAGSGGIIRSDRLTFKMTVVISFTKGRSNPVAENVMRYGPEQKARTRGKILEAAARLFRRDGYQASGVDKVMAEAGLTPGGFYAHFGSKQALLAEALAHAGAEMGARGRSHLEGLAGREWVEEFLAYYLSIDHRDQLEHGCPLVALVSEVARSDGAVKASFEGMVRSLLELFQANASGGDPGAREERALAAIALCVGGLGMARSVQDSCLASKLLDACRHQAGAILSGGYRPARST